MKAVRVIMRTVIIRRRNWRNCRKTKGREAKEVSGWQLGSVNATEIELKAELRIVCVATWKHLFLNKQDRFTMKC